MAGLAKHGHRARSDTDPGLPASEPQPGWTWLIPAVAALIIASPACPGWPEPRPASGQTAEFVLLAGLADCAEPLPAPVPHCDGLRLHDLR